MTEEVKDHSTDPFYADATVKMEGICAIVGAKFGKHVADSLRHSVRILDTCSQLSTTLAMNGILGQDGVAHIETVISNNLRGLLDIALHKAKDDTKREVYGLIGQLSKIYLDAMEKSMTARYMARKAQQEAAAAAAANEEAPKENSDGA